MFLNEFEKPDIVLLDVNMPIMDGWSFIHEYQSLDSIQKNKMKVILALCENKKHMQQTQENKSDEFDLAAIMHQRNTKEQ